MLVPGPSSLQWSFAAATTPRSGASRALLPGGGDPFPDALLAITSRFQRLRWKHRSTACAVSLTHVGVLHQTMDLVASATGIGACGQGSGDSDLSVTALDLDHLVESSVGEFVIGSAPSASLAPGARDEPTDPTCPGADWAVRAARRRAEHQLPGGRVLTASPAGERA